MSSRFRRLIATITAVSMLCISTWNPSFAKEIDSDVVSNSNEFIEYVVDKNDGRFIIWTEEGSPIRDTDEDKRLLFDKNSNPETSYTTFKIDGKEYIYGNDYGFLGLNSLFLEKPTNYGGQNVSKWSMGDIVITQTLEILDDKDQPNIGNVKIRYDVKNKSNKSKKIGTKILLDTMLGDEDGAPFIIGGQDEPITKEKVLINDGINDEIPTYWRSTDNLFAPSVVAYGFTKGWGNEAPNKMVMAHWESLDKKYDYEVDENLDFTSKVNKYGSADSSVAFYWDEITIKPGKTKVFETYYGLGDFSNVDSNSPFDLSINNPSTLTVNDSNNGYNEDEVEVSVTVDNTLSNSEDLTHLNVKLACSDLAFNIIGADANDKSIILKGETSTFTFKLKPLNQEKYKSEPIRVEISGDNFSESKRYNTYILMPSIQGNPPEIQIQSVSPKKIYYKGDRSFSIKGKGFDAYKNLGLWNLYIVNESEKEYRIPDKCINVASDTKISVNIEDEDIEETRLGKYYVKLDHSNQLFGVLQNKELTVEMTDEEVYKARNYGALFIEKRSKNNNFYYYLNSVDSKGRLDELKENIKDGDVPKEFVDDKKGELVGIVFDVIGDVKEFNEKGQKVYKVSAENKDAIINSAVIYKKGSSTPLEIKKDNKLDMITIKGNGTLQMPNYGEFWWFPFSTYISDKTDYVINKVIEDGEYWEDVVEIIESDSSLDEDRVEYAKENIKGEEDEDKIAEILENTFGETKAQNILTRVSEIPDSENIVISIFDPLSIVSNGVGMVFDGFEAEIRDVILLDEGASFGGLLSLDIPLKTKSKQEDNDDSNMEKIASAEDVIELTDIIFDIFQEMDDKKSAQPNDKRKTTPEERKEKRERTKKKTKIIGIILNEDQLYEEFKSLSEDNIPNSEKAETLVSMITTSISLMITVYEILHPEEEDENEKGNLGFRIDVQKILFGKKYSTDEYNSFRYIGLDGEGEINFELPVSGIKQSKEAGVLVSVDTIKGVYSMDLNVDVISAEAHAYITLMRFNNKMYLDDLVLSGGFKPGVPISPPIFINEIGGGVQNLAESFINTLNPPLVTVSVLTGLTFEPIFYGDFRLDVTKEGFDLDGSFEFKNGAEFLEEAHLGVRWSHPVYVEAKATLNVLETIMGEASFYVGEKATGNPSKPYKFYMEGMAKAKIIIPKKVPIVGGKVAAGIEVGISTEKIWGHLKIISIPVGLCYVYGKGVEFASWESLISMPLQNYALYSESFVSNKDKGTLMVGSNIKVVGSSNIEYVSANKFIESSRVLAAIDNKVHKFVVTEDQEVALIEFVFEEEVPQLKVKDPNGDIYPLIDYESDKENSNYIVQTISVEESESGKEEKRVYISVVNPISGTWIVESNKSVESKLMDVAVPPGFNSVTFDQLDENSIKVNWDAHHTEDSIVNIFLVNKETPDDSGYAIADNVNGNNGVEGIVANLPVGIPEGEYFIRATIQHPSYGYESYTVKDYIKIIDKNKPNGVEGLNVELYGNGLLDIAWDHVKEDGEISYYITIYDENGDSVPGFANVETKETSVVLGGQYEIINEEEQNEEETEESISVSLETGNKYTVGITTKKVLNNGEEETIHISDEVISDEIMLLEPNPPVINLNLDGQVKAYNVSRNANDTESNILRYINNKDININFAANQEEITTKIYVDGEYFIKFDGRSYKLALQFEDGEHSVKAVSENQYGDQSEEVISFIVDTTAPELMIDSPMQGQISNNGMISIKGTAESGALITINGQEIALDKNGLFDYQYTLDNNTLIETLAINATDIAGNKNQYTTDVTNDTIKPFKKVYIKPLVKDLLSETQTQFNLYALDINNKEIKLESSDVNWYIMEGDAIADISDDGILTTYDGGEIILKGSYYVSEEYSFDHAIQINVRNNINGVRISPNIDNILVGKELDFNLYETTKYDENIVDNAKIKWEIIQGSDYGSIDEFGHFIVKAIGSVIIKASYTDIFNNVQEKTLDINIVDEVIEEIEDNKDVDNKISEIWLRLISSEKGLQIQRITVINKDFDRMISVRNKLDIQVPAGTVSKSDELFIGTIKDKEELLSDKEKLYSEIYELQLKEAEGNLQKPISITFKFDSNKVNNYKNLGVYYYNPTYKKWQYIGGEIDSKNGTVKVDLNHLSKYAVLEKEDISSFKDIKGRWSEKDIKKLKSLGLINGVERSDGTYFEPTRNITKLEIAALIVRVFNLINNSNEKVDFYDYNDIPKWGREYADIASYLGIVKGEKVNGNLLFNPFKNATREEVVTMIGRIIELLEENKTLSKSIKNFEDKADISNWSSEYINKLTSLEIINGYPDNTFKPKNNITREEVVKILSKWIEVQ